MMIECVDLSEEKRIITSNSKILYCYYNIVYVHENYNHCYRTITGAKFMAKHKIQEYSKSRFRAFIFSRYYVHISHCYLYNNYYEL